MDLKNDDLKKRKFKEFDEKERKEFIQDCLNDVKSELLKLLSNSPIFYSIPNLFVGIVVNEYGLSIKGSYFNTVKFRANIELLISNETGEVEGLKPTISDIEVPSDFQNKPEHWGSSIVDLWEKTLYKKGFRKFYISNVSNNWWKSRGYVLDNINGWSKTINSDEVNES